MALMIIDVNILNAEAFEKYSAAAVPFMLARGATVLAKGPAEILEGEWPWQGVVVFEWPLKATGIEAWQSPEYAELKKLRDGVAEFQCIITD